MRYSCIVRSSSIMRSSSIANVAKCLFSNQTGFVSLHGIEDYLVFVIFFSRYYFLVLITLACFNKVACIITLACIITFVYQTKYLVK